jgi:predicted PurR-regulated permease PerM
MSEQPGQDLGDEKVIGAPQTTMSRWRLTLPLALGIFAGAGALVAVIKFGEAIMVLILSVTIADALEPPTRWFKRIAKKRVYAATLVYLILLVLLCGVGYFLVPTFTHQWSQLKEQAPEIFASVKKHVNRLPDSIVSAAHTALMNSASSLSSLPMKTARALFDSVLIIFLSYYWLIAAPEINAFLRSLFPEHRKAQVDDVRAEMSHAMGGYVRGLAIDACLTGALAWAGLQLVGVPYAPVLGLITAVGELIPYIGPILSAIPAVLMGFLVSPGTALLALVVYTVILQIEAHVIAPNVIRSQTNLPQALIIIALFGGGVVGGLLGFLVAVPTAGAIKVLVDRVLRPWLRNRYREVQAVKAVEATD